MKLKMVLFALFLVLGMAHAWLGDTAQTVFCMGMSLINYWELRGDTV